MSEENIKNNAKIEKAKRKLELSLKDLEEAVEEGKLMGINITLPTLLPKHKK